MKKDSLREKISIFAAKSPRKAILIAIITFNLLFFILAGLVIYWLSPQIAAVKGFWAAVFYTVTMILDAGCIQFVIEDVGTAGVAIIIVCLLIVLIGMITFTGAVIGYLTTYISGFIDSANAGRRKLCIKNHTVILNWNSRASEIVNDLLYSGEKEKIVILVSEDADAVRHDVDNRIAETLMRENRDLLERSQSVPWLERTAFLRKNLLRNTLTVIVREGDVYSSVTLAEICVDQAKDVIILGRDVRNSVCRFEQHDRFSELERGNSNTIKALIQVADITSKITSADNQMIVTEVEDDWTLGLVQKIIEHKERLGKCNIVPMPINRVLGQILSQFTIMPELNYVYGELFSNKGAVFFAEPMPAGSRKEDENEFIRTYMSCHTNAVPVGLGNTKSGLCSFFMAENRSDIALNSPAPESEMQVRLNRSFCFRKRSVIILGHNSKMEYIIAGYDAFRNEWNHPDEEILSITILDDKASLEKYGYYSDSPYVTNAVEADVYEREKIYDTILSVVRQSSEDISILILSDDQALNEEVDAKALTYLIYVHDIKLKLQREDPAFNPASIDVIVEVLNPKNVDVVHSYHDSNVVISNRYISKMITQISEDVSIFDFYNDILTYDSADAVTYDSKELYAKRADQFFEQIPPEMSAYELIRAVFEAGAEDNKSLLLGYVRDETQVVFFSADQKSTQVRLRPSDKLVIFSNH